MRRLMAAMGIALLTLGAAGEASAAVNIRQLNQQRRIDAGVRSGKLTHREAARLRGEQRSIKRLQHNLRARNGGHLTERDKRMVHARQNAANRHILVQKHDRQRGRNRLKL